MAGHGQPLVSNPLAGSNDGRAVVSVAYGAGYRPPCRCRAVSRDHAVSQALTRRDDEVAGVVGSGDGLVQYLTNWSSSGTGRGWLRSRRPGLEVAEPSWRKEHGHAGGNAERPCFVLLECSSGHLLFSFPY